MYKLELIILALLTGIIRKIYDELIDEPQIYRVQYPIILFISILFFIMVLLLSFYDLSFLLLITIFILCNYLHLLFHKLFKYKFDSIFPILQWFPIILFIIFLNIYKFNELKKYFSNIYDVVVWLATFLIVFIETGIVFPNNLSKLLPRILFSIFLPLFIFYKSSIPNCRSLFIGISANQYPFYFIYFFK